MRYLVESTITVMFWLVPIVYPQLGHPPLIYAIIDNFNPLSAVSLAMWRIVMDGQTPLHALIGESNLCRDNPICRRFGYFSLTEAAFL